MYNCFDSTDSQSFAARVKDGTYEFYCGYYDMDRLAGAPDDWRRSRIAGDAGWYIRGLDGDHGGMPAYAAGGRNMSVGRLQREHCAPEYALLCRQRRRGGFVKCYCVDAEFGMGPAGAIYYTDVGAVWSDAILFRPRESAEGDSFDSSGYSDLFDTINSTAVCDTITVSDLQKRGREDTVGGGGDKHCATCHAAACAAAHFRSGAGCVREETCCILSVCETAGRGCVKVNYRFSLTVSENSCFAECLLIRSYGVQSVCGIILARSNAYNRHTQLLWDCIEMMLLLARTPHLIVMSRAQYLGPIEG